MIMDKIKLAVPVIVEGKYDKAALSSVADATIITTDGFGIFKSDEKRALIRRLSENGVIVLCDSDGAGGVIRSYISSFLPKDKLYQLYVPRISGKEKRKRTPSKEGILGVEGVPAAVLREALTRLIERNPELESGGDSAASRAVTKSDFYADGFSGVDGADRRRSLLAGAAGLPENMTANALLAAVNFIMTYDEYRAAADRLRGAE